MKEFLNDEFFYEPYIKNHGAKEKDIEFWNSRAKGFDEMYSLDLYGEDEFIFSNLDKLSLLKKTDSVIDIGCGVGKHSTGFARRVNSYLGSDIADKMIEIANKNLDTDTHLNIEFKTSDWENLKNKYDIAFSSMTPAVHSVETVKKISNLAKRYVIIHRFLSEKDTLSPLLGLPYFNPAHNNDKYIYGLVNILWHLGYHPQTLIGYENHNMTITSEDLNQRYSKYIDKMSVEEKNHFDDAIKSMTYDNLVRYVQTRERFLIYWKV